MITSTAFSVLATGLTQWCVLTPHSLLSSVRCSLNYGSVTWYFVQGKKGWRSYDSAAMHLHTSSHALLYGLNAKARAL